MRFQALLALSCSVGVALASPPHSLAPDVGNWTVGDCILAQFAMEFTVPFPNSSKFFDSHDKAPNSTTFKLDLPVNAVVDKSQRQCGNNTQVLSFDWSSPALNDSAVNLYRNLTVVFAAMNQNDSAVPGYGVRQMYGTFEMARFSQMDPKTNVTMNISSYLDVDTGLLASEHFMFKVPVGRSYLCSDIGQISMYTHLHYDFPDEPKQGQTLMNTTVSALHVQVDAFRTKESPAQGFQIPMDCDYEPNDVVPIVVGAALAILVVVVLVAYLLGRRRSRQRGYQSV
ncbi:hypothetical protein TCAL_01332 [Tigriopus californicus]|uniref:Lysosome-associated membrane glycoprotein 2-like transmembrane domain-containing protein n=1 Tax=Tigriopus californicus TaxID=6832 RepID=A0A553PC84_TIGCA|nr:uncharacterized protein LOC131892940 [Tigriopus californicus]TRY75297.1 hypothetical protein TCAL_01332 [Tigriopus californicus]